MSLEGFGKISTNIDILIRIYKLLEVEDQLRLSCVTDLLRSIYLTYIDKQSYRDLEIVKGPTYFYVANAKNPKPVLLQEGDLKDFLLAYGANVHELTESRAPYPRKRSIFYLKMIDICHFPNLTSLTYEVAEITSDHLSLVAQFCENLQSLRLMFCSTTEYHNDVDRKKLVIGDTLSVDTLLSFNNLHHLSINNSNFSLPAIKYRHFRQLLGQSCIESLKVQYNLMPDHELPVTDTTALALRELTIATTFDSDKWSYQFSSFLTCFENLRSLNLTLTELITDQTMTVITETCKSLEIFIIRNSTFLEVQTLKIPLSVKDLSINNCSGLTYNNLKHILTQLKISKFTSKSTKYIGVFEHFKISPLIKCLSVRDIHMNGFKLRYTDNQSLQELTWIENDDHNYNEDDEPLKIFPNLRILIVNCGLIPCQSLVQKSNLNVLQLLATDKTSNFNWSYIVDLLKHPPLTELSIDYFYDHEWYDDSLLKSADCPVAAFDTNVKVLTITFEILSAGLQFWLELYQRNRQLRLVWDNFDADWYYLNTLVYDEKFPKHSSYIDVWGTTIRCDDLRKNFDVVDKKLSEHREQILLNFEHTDRLVLYRK